MTILAQLFRAPADAALRAFERHYPDLASAAGLVPDNLSSGEWNAAAAACWIGLLIAVWIARVLLRRAARLLEFACRSVAFHANEFLKSMRTSLRLRFRRRSGNGRRIDTPTAYAVDLSELDLSVLRAAASLMPAHSTSAPDLADTTKLRTAEIQQSLEKLYRNKLLDSTMGSTDGFDNYVISSSGAAFYSMISRR